MCSASPWSPCSVVPKDLPSSLTSKRLLSKINGRLNRDYGIITHWSPAEENVVSSVDGPWCVELRAWEPEGLQVSTCVRLKQKQDYIRFVSAATALHLDLMEVDTPLLFHLIYNLIALTLDSLQTQICGFSETRKSKVEQGKAIGKALRMGNGWWTLTGVKILSLLKGEIIL